MTIKPDCVTVALGERAYDILVGPGLIEDAGGRVRQLRPGAKVAIVSDETVMAHHGAALKGSLDRAGILHSAVVVTPGEGSKNWATLERVCEALIAAKLERKDLVIALGGGVVGDLAGCAAALVRRGIDFVQIPTSLLAQVDSSVGGKTGINSPSGKNLIGAFHQPILVLADTAALRTLSERHLRAGYAEVAKYGLLGDQAFFAWLEENRANIFAHGPQLEQAIARSCAMKAGIVARDETEQGERALLNLGHTFGHALEALTGYGDRLLHGEGVAIGMAQAFRFSAALGLLSPLVPRRVEDHLRESGLPTRLSDISGTVGSVDDIMAAMAQDKKVSRGQLTFILAKEIGEAFIAREVAPDRLRAFLLSEFDARLLAREA